MSEQKIPIPAMLYNAAVDGHVTSSQQIIDENLNREQNDINQETVGTVPYNSTTPNGMGRIVLKKTDDFKTVVEAQTDGNTIFVIKYDFTLAGNVDVPNNCVLEFDGGSISGGTNKNTITGSNTRIIGNVESIFDSIIIAGSWNVPVITSKMFVNATSNNVIKELVHLSSNDIYNIIIVEDGTYTLDIEGDAFHAGLWLKSNTKFIVNGHIKLNATESPYGSVINVYNKENVEICGSGIIEGEASYHTTKEGEWCHGIFVGSSKNVYIHDIESKNNWGDGICVDCITHGYGTSKYVKLERCISHDNKRLGIGVGYCKYISIDNCEIYNISGKNPQAGIDLEPNADNEELVFCSIKNCYIHDCQHGIALHSLYSTFDFVNNVTIDNCRFENIQEECIFINAIMTLNVTNTYLSTITSEYVVVEYKGNIIFNNCTVLASNATRLISNSAGFFNFYDCTINTPNALLYTAMNNSTIENCNITINGDLTLYAVIINSRLIHNSFNKLQIKQNITSLEVRNNTINYLSMYQANGETLIFEDNVINFDENFTASYIFYIRIANGTFKNNVINIADKTKITRTVFLLANGCKLKLENDTFNENGTISNWSIEQFGGADNMIINAKNTYAANSGSTSHRPSTLSNDLFDVGFEYFDVTISKKIYWNGITWVDALGNPVDTIYPKVIGTPTAGNLVKFNNTDSHNIEDAGVTPQV